MSSYKVPVYSQTTANLCWEACARMMWFWKHKTLSKYKKWAGAYATANKGLGQEEMDGFYKHLGLQSLHPAEGKNLRFALGWTPVIFTSIEKTSGHAMVASGFAHQTYTVVNPCAVEAVSFDNDANSDTTCSAGKASLPRAYVDASLGNYIWYWRNS